MLSYIFLIESNKMKNTKYQTVESVPKIQRKIAKRGKIDPVQVEKPIG
jgi:hypothetical protein